MNENTMIFFQELHQQGFFDNVTTAAGYRCIYKKTLAHLPAGSHVLDWGSGNGWFSYFLLKNRMNTIAYTIQDYLKSKTELQKQWPDFNYVIHNDPCTLPFASETFDAVFSVGVLEHVRETGGNELASLNELKRVLKRNGKIFCFHLPRKYSWIEKMAKTFNLKQYRHTYLYSRRDVARLLAASGFTLLEMGRYNAVPRNILSRLPGLVKNSRIFCGAYNFIDDSLAAMLPFLAQNIFFIALKE